MTRLTPALFDILIVLSRGASHGYAVAQAAAKLTRPPGKAMGPATLYTSLQKLLDAGWIRELPARVGDDPRRKTYELTDQGGAVLAKEVAQQRQRLDAVFLVGVTTRGARQ